MSLVLFAPRRTFLGEVISSQGQLPHLRPYNGFVAARLS